MLLPSLHGGTEATKTADIGRTDFLESFLLVVLPAAGECRFHTLTNTSTSTSLCGLVFLDIPPMAVGELQSPSPSLSMSRLATNVIIDPHFFIVREYSDIKYIVNRVKTDVIPLRHTWLRVDEDGVLPVSEVSNFRKSNTFLSSVLTSTKVDRQCCHQHEGQTTSPPPPSATTASSSETVPLPPPRLERAEPLPAGPPNDGALPFSSSLHFSDRGPPPKRPDTDLPTASPSPTAKKRSILFLWDIDDTLVASGAEGLRQNPVFSDTQLATLFRAAGPRARHLLLSQGSIEDVFAAGGCLRSVEQYFNLELASEIAERCKKEKERVGTFGGLFPCMGTKLRKSPVGRGTNFEETVVVRLGTIRGSSEAPGDADFLYDPTKQPGTKDADDYDVRWLILRPSTYGITLACLNALIPPSPHTAFVNGRQFHKIDVAWSLACSGHWDTVFFMDNNLSELGVVRYGMQMADMQQLYSSRRVFRFFQSEFLLLAASAKLLQLPRGHGRNVTKPMGGTSATTSHSSASLASAENTHLRRAVITNGRIPKPDDGVTTVALTGAACTVSELSSSTEFTMPPSKTTDKSLSDVKGAQKDAVSCEPGSLERVSPTTQGPPAKNVALVLVHFHMPAEEYRRTLLGNLLAPNGQVRTTATFAASVGQPTFMGDSSLSDDQYEALMTLFRYEESMLYQLMEEDMRSLGYVDMGWHSQWVPNVHMVCRPVYRRPVNVLHMRDFYRPLITEVEKNVVEPLISGGGSADVSAVVRAEANHLYQKLLRECPLIDPGFVYWLAEELFLLHLFEGNLTKGHGESVRRQIKRTMEPRRGTK